MTVLYYAFKNTESDEFIIKALQDFTGQKKEFKIYRKKNKKPYVEDANVYFSLSHTEGLTICAVSDCEVGADAEKIRSLYGKEKITKRFLKKEGTLSDSEFFLKWTAFESRVKYFGESIFNPEKALSISKPAISFEKSGFAVSVCTDDNIIRKELII